MCVIAIKEVNKPPLPEHIIEDCWYSNPHGAGFAIQRGGPGSGNTIEVDKGFMTLRSFKNALSKANISDSDMVVYHFRIATSGGINPQKCHPFPLVTDKKVMERLKYTHDRIIFHNGIFNHGKNGLSDTQLFAMDLAKRKTIDIDRLAKEINDSKFYDNKVVLMMKEASWYFGGFIRDGDYLFSNDSHIRYRNKLTQAEIMLEKYRDERGKSMEKEVALEEAQKDLSVDDEVDVFTDTGILCPVCGVNNLESFIEKDSSMAAMCNYCGEDFVQCTKCGDWTEFLSYDFEHICVKCCKEFFAIQEVEENVA